jgi:iron(III) transport system ATP-binding protein
VAEALRREDRAQEVAARAPDAAGRAPYLRIRRLTKRFGAFTALRDVSLDVFPGEFVCFLGPSGCGKTTLLRAIAGLDPQTEGTVEQDGRDVSALPPERRDFGIVFQSYALFPNLTAAQNVAYGLENRRLARAEIQRRVQELLALVGLPEQGAKYPSQLSGGQQQRVAVARALATSPGLFLLDEPLSALDAKVRVHLRQEIAQLQRRLGITTIMVTHDQEEALTMADRIVVMNHGAIEQVGTPLEVYRAPASAFVADFIGTMNFLSAVATGPGAVRVGAVELAVAAPLAAGTPVTLAIRPEDVRLRTSPDGDGALPAQVGAMAFVGSFFRVELTGESLGGARVRADVGVEAAQALALRDGQAVWLSLPAAALRVYQTAPAVADALAGALPPGG